LHVLLWRNYTWGWYDVESTLSTQASLTNVDKRIRRAAKNSLIFLVPLIVFQTVFLVNDWLILAAFTQNKLWCTDFTKFLTRAKFKLNCITLKISNLESAADAANILVNPVTLSIYILCRATCVT